MNSHEKGRRSGTRREQARKGLAKEGGKIAATTPWKKGRPCTKGVGAKKLTPQRRVNRKRPTVEPTCQEVPGLGGLHIN